MRAKCEDTYMAHALKTWVPRGLAKSGYRAIPVWRRSDLQFFTGEIAREMATELLATGRFCALKELRGHNSYFGSVQAIRWRRTLCGQRFVTSQVESPARTLRRSPLGAWCSPGGETIEIPLLG